MAIETNNTRNVYQKINFIRYFMQMISKHKAWVISVGLILGIITLAASYIQIYTSSTIYRFQVTDSSSTSLTPNIQLDNILGKTESLRDKAFTYVQSIPFYFELAKNFNAKPEGKRIIKIFSRSKTNVLFQFKKLFFDTFAYETKIDSNLQLAQYLQKVMSFKKDSDNTLILYVRTGMPELSLELSEILGPMVKDIILNNESFNLNVSETHLKDLMAESHENLERMDKEFLAHKKDAQKDRSSDNATFATLEIEKELRMARIEVQRFDHVIKTLEKQINENSTFAGNDGEHYKYVDQVAMERLAELKQQRELAFAKASSVREAYEKFKKENQNRPVSEQQIDNLKWSMELEHSINKELQLKSRDIEGLKKLLENSVRIIGESSLVPVKFKISRPFRFLLGFAFGALLAVFGIYYFFDFFKVIKGNHDLRDMTSGEILNSIPNLNLKSNADVWKDLPANHHAIEAFRHIMELSLSARVVTCLSAEKNDGKSFIISNLAENLARFGKKVVIIDTNWSKPTLTNAFIGNSRIKVVSADRFKHGKDAFLDRSQLISEIKTHSRECDIVLIDTQNLNDSNDALVVASVSNLNIVVASHLETYQHKFYNLLKKLEASQITNYCFLLNKANISDEILSFRGNVRVLDDVDTNMVYMKKSS